MTPAKKNVGKCDVQDLRISTLEDDMTELQKESVPNILELIKETRSASAGGHRALKEELHNYVERFRGFAYCLALIVGALSVSLTLQRLGYIPPPPGSAAAATATQLPGGQ